MTARQVALPGDTGVVQRLLARRIAVRWEFAAYAAIFGIAFGLRFFDLGTRALHHDESIHAQWSWSLLQGSYRHSPVKKLIMDYKVALPLHPEYRTMPMVWYIPPLSPVVDVIKDTGYDAEDLDNLFGAIHTLRIPVEYLANLFTAGDVEPVNGVLKKLAAMRVYPAININRSGTRREELLIEPDMLAKIWILRKLLHPMDELAAIEFLLDKMKTTKSNDEFFQSMKR